MNLCRSLAILVPGLLLVACATPPTEPLPATRWEQQLARITALQDWQFSGKVAVATDAMSETARLSWQQQGQRSELTLSGPVGWQQARVISDGSRLRLQRDGQWQEFATDDHQSLEEQLGWPLPLDYLPYWVRGVPAPGVSTEHLDVRDGRLVELRQAGWQIEYETYQPSGELQLPARLRMSREGVQGRLIVKDWQLGGAL